MLPIEKYQFSFTASSFRLNEMIEAARFILEEVDFDVAGKFGSGKSSTGKRMWAEFKKRLETLTQSQLKLLVFGDFEEQRHIGFFSICKTYSFVRDFVVEVLREKIVVYDYEITEGDYISFYRRKFETHQEMESLTEKTEAKVRQVTFKILEQSGIIDSVKTRCIQPQILSEKVVKVIAEDNMEWLKVFLLSDFEINNVV